MFNITEQMKQTEQMKNLKTEATYPDGCNDATKQFIDKVNIAMSQTGAIGILDEYYLGQNGVYNTIFKILLPNYNIAIIECFDDEGTNFYNEKNHKETVRVIKYNKKFKPIKQKSLSFNNINNLNLAIEFVNLYE